MSCLATLLSDHQNLRGLEYRFVSLFPWGRISAPDHHSGDDWARFIETYAGSIVIGNAEELYLVRALRPSGKQEQQIRLDVVSPRSMIQLVLRCGT